MRVSEIEVVADDEFAELRARVTCERDPDDDAWFAPFTLWHRYPAACAPWLRPDNGDPWLAALLLAAMARRERLVVPAPVSARLAASVPTLQDVFATFRPATYARVEVEVPVRAEPLPAPEAAPAVGLFFSMGVDSTYSLLKNRRGHPAGEAAVTHLVSLNGIDVVEEAWDAAWPPEILANLRRVAAETGTTLLPVTTNVRREVGRLAPWPMLHGGAMASTVLALGPRFRRLMVAASTTYDRLYPWGTHPVLDPLWSTEATGFVHDGCELDSIDKVPVVARSPLAMATLRVCPGYGSGYNCGTCLKCLRTALDLQTIGALESCATLPRTIDAEALRFALAQGGGPAHVADYRRRLAALATVPGTEPTRRVLAEHLARERDGRTAPHNPRRSRQRGSRLVGRWLGRGG